MTISTNVSHTPSVSCEACPMYRSANLKKLGINIDHWDYVVALAGNPNTGKSTLFNRLTGLHQHTGNWPGKTVTRAEGAFQYEENQYKIVDLPGTYSLLSQSLDEEVARDFILFGQPDVTIAVVDATSLERNLNLVLQILEITDRVVVCLNLMDEARRKGITVDERQLSRDLGVPVVPTAARSGKGIAELLHIVSDMAAGKIATNPYRSRKDPPALKRALAKLTKTVEAAIPGLPNARWVAMRLLDGDERVMQAFRSGELGNLRRAKDPEQASLVLTPEGA